jgi:hypothetical protein
VLFEVVTLSGGMIIVCTMFNYDTIRERYCHDPQTIYKETIDIVITEYVHYKPYA